MKKKVIGMFFVCMTMFVLCLGGCSQKASEEEQTVQEVTATPTVTATATPTPIPTPTVEVLKTIGVQDSLATEIKLINNTGKDIKSVAIKNIEDAEFPANLLAENDVFVNAEKRYLYFKEDASDSNADASADEKLVTPGYDVQLIFADDTSMVLHAFPFEDLTEGEICLDSEVAYLKYVSVSSGQSVETKEAELTIKAQEEAEAAAAVAQADYEEDYSDDYYEEDYSDDYYEEDYSDDYYEEPSDDWSDDSCLDDALVY